ncbi:MAG TPA: hypothetical protein VFK76_10710 [Gaiellaceae bacterium]|nr:hypothetical protein [Gaiellaceae bacterium]
MTSHTGRLYGLAGALFAFFLLWAVVAAHPWATPAATSDPRLATLAQREKRLRADAALVQQIVDRRFAAYKVALAKRQAEIAAARSRAAASLAAAPVSQGSAAAPSVRVVTLPPLVITKTS